VAPSFHDSQDHTNAVPAEYMPINLPPRTDYQSSRHTYRAYCQRNLFLTKYPLLSPHLIRTCKLSLYIHQRLNSKSKLETKMVGQKSRRDSESCTIMSLAERYEQETQQRQNHARKQRKVMYRRGEEKHLRPYLFILRHFLPRGECNGEYHSE
jgi:hypothetical protein